MSPADLGLGPRYDLAETWDLSTALSPETLGELASDLAIDFAVGALGVPSSLESEAKVAVTELVGDQISAPVASAVADSPELAALRESIRAVDVSSEWIFNDGLDRARVLELGYVHDSTAITLDLSPAARGVELSGALSLSASTSGHVQVAPFPLAIAPGELVRPLAEAPLELALAQTDCAAIANALTGGTGELSITAGGVTYSQTAANISTHCESMVVSLADALLEEMDRELLVRLGGEIAVDGDPARSIASAESWAGTLEGVPFAAAFFGVASE